MGKRAKRTLSGLLIAIVAVILFGIFVLHIRVLPNDTIALQGTYVRDNAPQAVVIHSRQELEDAIGIGNNVTFWDASGTQVGADSLMRFDDKFFEKNDLVVSLYQATSGSDMVKVNCAYKIPLTPNGAIVWVTQQLHNGWRSTDMANWTILIPISK